ncbi:MAG: 50S ribosomal protein L11 methyltransferase [Verrucomicrobiia bacterium]|jgi:ribosomal protein L11 methyltransferase
MKTTKSLWRVSVATTPEAEDAVSELLGAVLGRPASCFFNLETGVSTVTVYQFMNLGAPASRWRVSSRLAGRRRSQEQVRREILDGLERITNCGLKIGSGKVTLGKVRREDWAESWKRHFKPIEIGDALLVKPSWSKRRARKNQAVVVLDPGLSFGTGQHPTTAFCLRELARHRTNRPRWSFLDMGTGSGILAIAAAKLGYSPVCAFDFDPEAVRVARANTRANGVHKKLRITRKDVTKLRIHAVRQYDLICANLVSPLLVSERRRIVSRLKRGGTLVLAGILKSEFSQVQKVFAELGLKLAGRKVENEWCSGSFYFAKKYFGKF